MTRMPSDFTHIVPPVVTMVKLTEIFVDFSTMPKSVYPLYPNLVNASSPQQTNSKKTTGIVDTEIEMDFPAANHKFVPNSLSSSSLVTVSGFVLSRID